MRNELVIVIHEDPKPAPRPKINKKTGGIYFPGDYRQYIRDHAEKISAAISRPAIKGPVALEVNFFRKSIRKVDLDNLEKTIMDILVKAGIISDDSLVIEKRSRLVKGSPYPRTEVKIVELHPQAELWISRD